MKRSLLQLAGRPWVVWPLLALPGLVLLAGAVLNRLGANPAEALLRGTGDWALRGLLLTLAISPLRTWTGWTPLARWRRWCGVATFGYASLHALAYAWLDMGLVWADIWRDLPKRPFAALGALAWCLLLPLALTSFNRAIRALGAARWQRLHLAVHGAASAALLHYLWMRAGKHRALEIWPEALLLALLWAWRVRRWRRRQHAP